MGSMKISVTITLASVCLVGGANTTGAETRYFWSDAEGEIIAETASQLSAGFHA
jgi:hypothetical protein